jgi:D-alanyl-D-alanine dipeptidase
MALQHRLMSCFSAAPTRAMIVACAGAMVSGAAAAQAPESFIDLGRTVPEIETDIRYATPHNFVGDVIPGYEAAACLLTRQAAEALARVQNVLSEFELALKVYDCYRPQRAVDAFVEWARDPGDQRMKAEFYPDVAKEDLFRDGYIAARSGHSRGSTVDLTIVPMAAPEAIVAGPPFDLRSCERSRKDRFPDASIDMGTGYDCFSLRSHTLSPEVNPEQRANRLLLKQLMEANGFVNLPEEWWHFTLADEPFPHTYFDFPIQ